MKYYIVSQSLELMRGSYFIYRKAVSMEKDTIVALVEDEYAGDSDITEAIEKLLTLEGEYRNLHGRWDNPSVNLDARFMPRFSL